MTSSASVNHRGLWSGSPMAPHNPVGLLVWGASPWTWGRGAGDVRVQVQPAGPDPDTPTLLGAGVGMLPLSLVPFPVHRSGIRCWEENSVCWGCSGLL